MHLTAIKYSSLTNISTSKQLHSNLSQWWRDSKHLGHVRTNCNLYVLRLDPMGVLWSGSYSIIVGTVTPTHTMNCEFAFTSAHVWKINSTWNFNVGPRLVTSLVSNIILVTKVILINFNFFDDRTLHRKHDTEAMECACVYRKNGFCTSCGLWLRRVGTYQFWWPTRQYPMRK